jgi:hypothetical protein
MARIEILTEEPSMSEVLAIILPKILSNQWILGENYFIRAHEGKSDLQKSIPRKIKAFSNYHEPVGVIILHDQDAYDCKDLKAKLLDICNKNGDCPTLIRIVCRELESWYLGDMSAIKQAYPKFKIDQYRFKAKFRKPDELNAVDEIKKVLPEFQKVASAKAISPYLDIKDQNKSESFIHFVSEINRFLKQFEKV